jgi:hypothetical protein
MSRRWTEYEYVDALLAWEFIDLQVAKMELQQEEQFVTSSEACKLIMYGKKEILDALSSFVHEHSKRLKEIVDDHNIPTTEDPEDGFLD